MGDIKNNIIGSVASAILISLLFFVWNDFLYKKDRLTGYWKVEFETVDSSYNKYIGLKTYYDFLISQDGVRLMGTGEKIAENTVNGIIEYDADKRTHIKLAGGITYKFFSQNLVDILFTEEGRKRPSSTILKMKIESPIKIIGSFISTISNSKGNVTFTRANNS